MRVGISATSSIFPKNFLTRFRPINVCAIMSSRSIEPSGSNRPAQTITLEPTGRPPRFAPWHAHPRVELSWRSGRLSRGPQSIATVGTGVGALFSGDSVRKPNHRGTPPWNPRIAHRPARGYLLSKHRLLNLNLGTDLFEGRLDLGGLVLVDAFLDCLGRALDQVLGLLEAEAGDGADFLDHLNLLLA